MESIDIEKEIGKLIIVGIMQYADVDRTWKLKPGDNVERKKYAKKGVYDRIIDRILDLIKQYKHQDKEALIGYSTQFFYEKFL
jgi:hypothetical protein